MKDLFFGVDYYHEYMKENRLDKDFAMMKKCGMNTIRIAESTWSTEEPEDGLFDFSYVGRVLDKASEYGLSVIIGTPTYAVPSWLAKKDPDVMVTTKKGRMPYGFRQLINILNPSYLFHAERIIRKLAEYTAPFPSVIGYQLDNETKYYDNFGRQMQDGFISHLKMRFKSIEEMNEAFGLNYWSNAVHSWEDFPDMKGCINASLCGEFEDYQRRVAADFLKWQAAIVDEYRRPDQFLTHNLDFEWRKFGADIAQDGYSYGVQPGIDHLEASKALTLTGVDIYHPTQSSLTGAEIAFGGDMVRPLKDEPYLVLETQAQAFKYWTPYPKQLTLHAFSHLASGSCGQLYWNWHSIHNGYETYWKGLLSHDMEENPVYDEACLIGASFKRIGAERLIIKKKARAAIVVDNRSLTALKWFPVDRDVSYNDVFRWLYDSLYELNLECDVVHLEALEPEKYEVIFTPALYCVSDEMIEKLRTFVEKGGTLVSTFRSFFSDRDSTARCDRQPHAMTDLFGISYQSFVEPDRLYAGEKECRAFAELIVPKEAKVLLQYRHRYWGKYAAATINSFGEGEAVYIGAMLDKSVLKKLLAGIGSLNDLRAQEAVFADKGENPADAYEYAPISWPLIVRSGKNALGREVHYLLHYSEDDGSYRCPYEKVTDLLTGKSYRRGDEIALSDWSVQVLEED